MYIAFVFFNADPGKERDVLKYFNGLPEVKEAHLTYGAYDGVARVEEETMDKLKEVLTWKVRRHDSLRSTVTFFVAYEV